MKKFVKLYFKQQFQFQTMSQKKINFKGTPNVVNNWSLKEQSVLQRVVHNEDKVRLDPPDQRNPQN